MIHSKVI